MARTIKVITLVVVGAFMGSVASAQVNQVNYCTGKTTTQDCVPFMSSAGAGLPSVSDINPFNLRGNDHIPSQSGILVYSFAKGNLNFHGGKLCVSFGFVRSAIKAAKTKTVVACVGPVTTGRLTNNFNIRIQSGTDSQLTAGQKVFTQWVQRDPANTIGGTGLNLSDGLRFTIQP